MEMTLIASQMHFKGSGLPRSDAKETGIVHVSDVIKYVQAKVDPIKDNDWDLPMAAEVGFLWEEVYSTAFADRYATIRPDEVIKSGMVGSPDGVCFEDVYVVDPAPGPENKVLIGAKLCDEEYKATWRHMRKTPDQIWYWMTQFKSYCFMLDTDTTYVKILYVVGDYRGSGPQYREYRLKFTEYEIYDNWKMLELNLEEMKRKGMWRYEG